MASTATVPLTEEQLAVILLIQQGKTNVEIATARNKTIGAVSTTINRILKLLNLKKRRMLIHYDTRTGVNLFTAKKHTGKVYTDHLLTRQECRVCNRLIANETYDLIALEMRLSQRTIETYARSAYSKLRVKGIPGLLAFWLAGDFDTFQRF